MSNESLIQVVATLLAVAGAASRILPLTRPLWAKLPAPLPTLLPSVLVVAGSLPGALVGVQTWTDFTVAVLGAIMLAVPGAVPKTAGSGTVVSVARPANAVAPGAPPKGTGGDGAGSAGGASGASVAALILALALSPAVATGCAPRDGAKAVDASTYVDKGIALAFNGAVAALVWCDTRETQFLDALYAHLESGGLVTRDVLENAALRVQRIERAAHALSIARKWLAGERAAAEGMAALRDAVSLLSELAAQLRDEGVAVPQSVIDGLKYAAMVLGVNAKGA